MKNTADIRSQMLSLLRRARIRLKDNFWMESRDAGRIAMDGLLRRNPVFVLVLGICPALAVTTCLQSAVGMGLATAAVLICSNLTISLLRNVIRREIRTLSHLIIIAAFAAAADLLMQAYAQNLSEVLGLYTPLIAVNCILLGRVETFASQNPPGKAFLDGLFTGLGFAGALAILGGIREILGAGTIGGIPVPVFNEYPVGLILSPCGGFLTLGFLMALVQVFRRCGARKESEVEPHEPC